jgi:hypothetical protein
MTYFTHPPPIHFLISLHYFLFKSHVAITSLLPTNSNTTSTPPVLDAELQDVRLTYSGDVDVIIGELPVPGKDLDTTPMAVVDTDARFQSGR